MGPPRHRGKILLGAILVVLAVLIRLLLWAPAPPRSGGAPSREPEAGAPFVASDPSVGEVGKDAPGEARRPMVPGEDVSAGASLLVRVVEKGTGAPVPGFQAALLAEGAVSFAGQERTGVSDARGEILWEDLAWDSVRIFPPFTREHFPLQPGQRNERVHEVELLFTVEGMVVDPRGQPVPLAQVWSALDVSEVGRQTVLAVADASGSFSFPVHASESLRVSARSEGRAPSRVAMVGRPAEGRIASLRLTLGDEGGSILGTVVTPEGSPVPGATVHVHPSVGSLPPQEDMTMTSLYSSQTVPVSLPSRTGADGTFRFDDVPPGEASVRAIADGWAGTVAAVEVVPGATSSLRITLFRGARIAGTARGTDGRSLEGVAVVARRHTFAARATTTDREGRYVLENVQPGVLILEAYLDPPFAVQERADLEDGQELRWDPVFGVGGSIRGVLVDHEGVPLADTYVLATGEGEMKRVSTDAEGRFVIENCADQEYEIGAYPPGFGGPLSLAEGVRPSDQELELRLPEIPDQDAFAEGRILDSAGHPVVPVRVTGRHADWPANASLNTTSPDGTFRVGPTFPGEWSFSFESGAHPLLEHRAVLAAGETTDLGDLHLEEAVPLEVHLRRAGEDSVWALLWGPGVDELIGEQSGQLLMPPLRAGHYTLQVFGESTPFEVREIDLVPGQERRLDIELRSGVPHNVGVTLTEGTEETMLHFKTFDAAGTELASWRHRWSPAMAPRQWAFRPAAVRLAVMDENGARGEVTLGSEEDIVVVLR